MGKLDLIDDDVKKGSDVVRVCELGFCNLRSMFPCARVRSS